MLKSVHRAVSLPRSVCRKLSVTISLAVSHTQSVAISVAASLSLAMASYVSQSVYHTHTQRPPHSVCHVRSAYCHPSRVVLTSISKSFDSSNYHGLAVNWSRSRTCSPQRLVDAGHALRQAGVNTSFVCVASTPHLDTQPHLSAL